MRVSSRSFLLGVATGARSSLGLLVPAVLSRGRTTTRAAAAMVAAEMTVDKLPAAPDRTGPGPALARAAVGGGAGWYLARRADAAPLLPTLAGAAGAGVGTVAGAVGRELAGRRGLTWQAALFEDAAASLLAWWATRRR